MSTGAATADLEKRVVEARQLPLRLPDSPKVLGVKITYDREACQGHNRCYMLAPELFDTDDEGYAILLVEGEVPAELEEKARLAADNCPEFAIEIEE